MMSDCEHRRITEIMAVNDEEGGPVLATCVECDKPIEVSEFSVFDKSLVWTTDKPTKPGLYWASQLGYGPIMVEVETDLDGLIVIKFGMDGCEYLSEYDKWAGPLEPPR